MPHDSHYIDAHETTWSIQELLNSDRSRRGRNLSVASLWSEWACERRWGGHLPSPARLIGHPSFLRFFQEKREIEIRFIDTVEDHAARILAFVALIKAGVSLPPLIIGPDGRFWDGMHRLAALYLMQISETRVLDFSQIGINDNKAEISVKDVFDCEWLTSDQAGLVSHRLRNAEPYNHVYLPKVLRADTAEAIRLEYQDLAWRLSETDFYEQYEITLLDCETKFLGPALRRLREVVLSHEFCRLLSIITEIPSLRVSDIACHRSTPGQQIGIHTDYSENSEVCRLTLHFNPGWQDQEGGLFVVFAGPSLETATAIYPPEHNTAILFKISEKSFHAVTPVESCRERFSMVIATIKG